MNRPVMRITVTTAMRVRDVSRPRAGETEPGRAAGAGGAGRPARPAKAAKAAKAGKGGKPGLPGKPAKPGRPLKQDTVSPKATGKPGGRAQLTRAGDPAAATGDRPADRPGDRPADRAAARRERRRLGKRSAPRRPEPDAH